MQAKRKMGGGGGGGGRGGGGRGGGGYVHERNRDRLCHNDTLSRLHIVVNMHLLTARECNVT